MNDGKISSISFHGDKEFRLFSSDNKYLMIDNLYRGRTRRYIIKWNVNHGKNVLKENSYAK